MPSQTINPHIPDIFSNQLKTCCSPINVVRKHNAATAVVAYSAFIGTPRVSNLENHFGARPSLAISNSIRVEEYIPELPADKIALRITAFIKLAANANPAFSQRRVNGESAIFYPFAKTIYTQTSPRVLKKTLVNLKKDVKDTNFNVEELKKLWVENQQKVLENLLSKKLK